MIDCAQVVDRETITGLPGGAAAECLAVYHVDAAGLIARVQAKQIIKIIKINNDDNDIVIVITII